MSDMISHPMNPPGSGCAPLLRFRAAGFTNTGVDVPYAIMDGSPVCEYEVGRRTASEVLQMLATDVSAFAQASLGLTPPFEGAPFLGRNVRRMPGNPDLICTRITARPFEEGRPADYFVTDGLSLTEPDGWFETYSRHALVTVEYNTDDGNEPFADEMGRNEPETFTEAKWTIGGEFLNVGHQNSYWVTSHRDDIIDGMDFYPSGSGYTFYDIDPTKTEVDQIDPRNFAANYVNFSIATVQEQNNDFDVPRSVVIPLKEWTVTWRHVFHVPWATIQRIQGKVNESVMALFDFAPVECVLFTGATVTPEQARTPDGRKMYTVEYHFMEKQIWDIMKKPDDGDAAATIAKTYVILGWNHYWRPSATGDGGEFQRLVNRLENPGAGDGPYRRANFHELFQPVKPIFTPHVDAPNMMTNRIGRDSTERGRAPVTSF